MTKVFIGCSILEDEIMKAMQELGLTNQILYIDAALHVDFNLLEKSLKDKLSKANGAPSLLIGNKCHPDILNLIGKHETKIVKGSNCIEMLLGDKIKNLDQEAKTFYITSGWLRKWREIFIEGLKWDSIDARQNFGFYDRILLLDTGLNEIPAEELLDFFDYTQIPIEVYPIGLENLKNEIMELIR